MLTDIYILDIWCLRQVPIDCDVLKFLLLLLLQSLFFLVGLTPLLESWSKLISGQVSSGYPSYQFRRYLIGGSLFMEASSSFLLSIAPSVLPHLYDNCGKRDALSS